MIAATSLATPNHRHCSCTATARCVFFTDSTIGLLVERPDGPDVYDLGADVVFLFERVRDAHAQVHLPPVGDERDVRALARYAGLAEGDGVVSSVTSPFVP